MNAVVEIKPERADQSQVVALLDALDRDLGALDEAQANHIGSAVRVHERRGYARRCGFGGYPDNRLSPFMSKALS